MQSNPGYKTSEFWLMFAAIGLTKSGVGVNPEDVDNVVQYAPIMGASVYAIGRSLIKFFTR